MAWEAGDWDHPLWTHSPALGHSHLVTWQWVFCSLQLRAWLAHKNVPLAGDRPDGLWGWASKYPSALAARLAEQGKLSGDTMLSVWEADGDRPLPPSKTLTQSFISCSVAAARRTGHLWRVFSGV